METIKKFIIFLFTWGIMYPAMLSMTEIHIDATIDPPDPYDINGNWQHWVKIGVFLILSVILYNVW